LGRVVGALTSQSISTAPLDQEGRREQNPGYCSVMRLNAGMLLLVDIHEGLQNEYF
jgi:hypothetical protein